MMLPGVELARKRRVHHRHEVWAAPPDPTSSARLPLSHRPLATPMDESTLAARCRLEEKLHGLVGSRRPSPSSSSSPSPSTRSSRHIQYGEESSTPRAAAVSETRTKANASAIPERRNSSRAFQRTGSRIDLCAVCLDEVQAKQRITWLPCSHKYHTECVLPWLAAHSHCPCCRTHVPSSDQLL